MSYIEGFDHPANPTQTPPGPKCSGKVIIGILATVVLLAGAGVATYLWWPSKERPIDESAVNDVLLTPVHAGKILKTGTLIPSPQANFPFPVAESGFYTEFNPWPPIIDQDCIPGIDDKTAHSGSGWNAVRVQYLESPTAIRSTGDTGEPDVTVDYIQSVVTYPDSAAAARYVTSTTDRWKHCANRSINTTEQGKPLDPDQILKLAAVSERDGIAILPLSISTPEVEIPCAESVGARANLVIEIEVCGGSDPTDQVVRLAEAIRDKIDKAPRQE